MAKALKVFRTAIGFHDAYVAAPSRKAALEAWGAGSNLFAAGVAEEITDAKLMKAALARPGEVVRVLRGSADEQIAALGKSGGGKRGDRPTPNPSRKREGTKKAPSRKGEGGKKVPQPSRATVDRAEAALARGEARHRAALEKLRVEEAALARRRRAIEGKQRAERAALGEKVDEARERFRAAMAEWAE